SFITYIDHVRRKPLLTPLTFFFQAEDGIRDLTVTGVQTCALPIYPAGEPLAAVLPGLRVRARAAGEDSGVWRLRQHPGRGGGDLEPRRHFRREGRPARPDETVLARQGAGGATRRHGAADGLRARTAEFRLTCRV